MIRPVLLPHASARVDQLLDAVTRRSPASTEQATLARRPGRVLVQLQQHAVGALGESPWDSQALERVLAPHHVDGLDFRQVGELLASIPPTEESTHFDPDPLVDLGMVVLIGLALVRVGATRTLAEDHLRVLFGLVIGLGPLEDIHRLQGPPEHNLLAARAILDNIPTDRDERQLLPSNALALLTDPIERARWRLLCTLFCELGSETTPPTGPLDLDEQEGQRTAPWMALGPRLEGWSPPRPGPGARIQLALNSKRWHERSLKLAHRHPGGTTRMFPVHFDREADGPVAATTLPDDLGAGWLGLVDCTGREDQARDRRLLRNRWDALSARLLPETPVPTSLIPDPGPDGLLPPWPSSRPFRGGLPTLESLSLPAGPLRPGSTLELRWTSFGTTSVRVSDLDGDHEPNGSASLQVPHREGPWSFSVVPYAGALAGLPREVSVLVIQEESHG